MSSDKLNTMTQKIFVDMKYLIHTVSENLTEHFDEEYEPGNEESSVMCCLS